MVELAAEIKRRVGASIDAFLEHMRGQAYYIKFYTKTLPVEAQDEIIAAQLRYTKEVLEIILKHAPAAALEISDVERTTVH